MSVFHPGGELISVEGYIKSAPVVRIQPGSERSDQQHGADPASPSSRPGLEGNLPPTRSLESAAPVVVADEIPQVIRNPLPLEVRLRQAAGLGLSWIRTKLGFRFDSRLEPVAITQVEFPNAPRAYDVPRPPDGLAPDARYLWFGTYDPVRHRSYREELVAMFVDAFLQEPFLHFCIGTPPAQLVSRGEFAQAFKEVMATKGRSPAEHTGRYATAYKLMAALFDFQAESGGMLFLAARHDLSRSASEIRQTFGDGSVSIAGGVWVIARPQLERGSRGAGTARHRTAKLFAERILTPARSGTFGPRAREFFEWKIARFAFASTEHDTLTQLAVSTAWRPESPVVKEGAGIGVDLLCAAMNHVMTAEREAYAPDPQRKLVTFGTDLAPEGGIKKRLEKYVRLGGKLTWEESLGGCLPYRGLEFDEAHVLAPQAFPSVRALSIEISERRAR